MHMLLLPRFVNSSTELAKAIRDAVEKPPVPEGALPILIYERTQGPPFEGR